MSFEKEYPFSYATITKYGDSVVKEIRTRLRNKGNLATENLYDSIDYELKETEKSFGIGFLMAEYGTFIDKGRNGTERKWRNDGKGSPKWPRPEPILQWMKIKGIEESALYPIRRKIGTQGIKPTFFFTLPTTRRVKQFVKDIGKAMALDAQLQATKEIKKRKRK